MRGRELDKLFSWDWQDNESFPINPTLIDIYYGKDSHHSRHEPQIKVGELFNLKRNTKNKKLVGFLL